MGITLIYLNSAYIIRFLENHPIEWRDRELSKRGGPGDKIGITPTPAVHEFMQLLDKKRDIFTQAEYENYCLNTWNEWLRSKPIIYKRGLQARLCNNFYPAMVDSLHVAAILSEAGWFDTCILDSYDDAIGKTDLTLTSDGEHIKLALVGPTSRAMQDRQYKAIYRPGVGNQKIVTVQLDIERPRSPGNKRWFSLDDFAHLRPTPAYEEVPF